MHGGQTSRIRCLLRISNAEALPENSNERCGNVSRNRQDRKASIAAQAMISN